MGPVIDSVIAGLPNFILQSATALAIIFVGVMIYMWLTPHKEMALIRHGNTAAAISLAGAIIGIALPLAFALAFSVSVVDVLIWGSIALVLQLVAFQIVDLVLRDVSRRIEQGEIAATIFLVSVKLATAFVNAAALAG